MFIYLLGAPRKCQEWGGGGGGTFLVYQTRHGLYTVKTSLGSFRCLGLMTLYNAKLVVRKVLSKKRKMVTYVESFALKRHLINFLTVFINMHC